MYSIRVAIKIKRNSKINNHGASVATEEYTVIHICHIFYLLLKIS